MSTLTHVVQGSAILTFNSHTGLRFENRSTGEIAKNVNSLTSSPSSDLEFTVTWVVDPVFGEEVFAIYDGSGSYADSGGVVMLANEVKIKNCRPFGEGFTVVDVPVEASLSPVTSAGTVERIDDPNTSFGGHSSSVKSSIISFAANDRMTTKKNLPQIFDLTDFDVINIAFKIEGADTKERFNTGAFESLLYMSSNANGSGSVALPPGISKKQLTPGWNFASYKIDQFTSIVNKKLAWFQFTLNNKAGVNERLDLWYGGIWASKKRSKRTRIAIVFDDGFLSQYTEGFRYLSKKGILGSIAIQGTSVDGPGFVTLDNLNEMYAANWDVLNHSNTHDGMIASPDWNQDVVNGKNYNIEKGFTRAGDVFIVPGGQYTSAGQQSLTNNGYKRIRSAGNQVSSANYEFPGVDTTQIPGIPFQDASSSLEDLVDYLEGLYESGAEGTIYYHRISNKNEGITIPTQIFEDQIDYIANEISVGNLEVLKIGDMIQAPEKEVTSHLIETYGDSFIADNNGATAALRTNTSFTGTGYSQVRDGVGGNALGAIKARFDASYPIAGTNTVIIEGGINNIANPPVRTDLAAMQAATSAMVASVQLATHDLIIMGITPWKGHAEWTQARQDQTDQYNDWLAATYPLSYVDLYSPLEDPANPDQLRPEYFVELTNLHPSSNGYREMDYQVGLKRLKYSNSPNFIDLTGNLVPGARDASTYVNNDSVMGGNPVVLADGTVSSNNGIVTISSAGVSNNTATAPFTGAPSNTQIEASVLIREGNNLGARFDVTNNSGNTTTAQIDVRNVTIGTTTGNGVFTVSKFDRGWIKVTCNMTAVSNIGTSQNTLRAWTMGVNEFVTPPGDGVTPGSYVDAFFMKAV